jgi:hypothetical protein
MYYRVLNTTSHTKHSFMCVSKFTMARVKSFWSRELSSRILYPILLLLLLLLWYAIHILNLDIFRMLIFTDQDSSLMSFNPW